MQQELAQALSELKNLPLDTAEEINAWVDVFIRRCTQVIEKMVPKSKPSERSKPGWSRECTEAVARAKQAERKFYEKATL
jgi:hypothetical protein